MPPDPPRFLRLRRSAVSKTVRIFPRSAPDIEIGLLLVALRFHSLSFVVHLQAFSNKLFLAKVYVAESLNRGFYVTICFGDGRSNVMNVCDEITFCSCETKC